MNIRQKLTTDNAYLNYIKLMGLVSMGLVKPIMLTCPLIILSMTY
jgi:hypothetical protein